MAWCPICKCEYTQGITHCPDCDVELVETLEEKPLDKSKFVHAFVESSAREEEMKSSGVSFLIVGILLLAAAALIYLGIIPIGASSGQKIFNTAVIAIFGIAFLAVSVVSYKRAKQLSVSSVREEQLTEEIIEYCLANYQEPVSSETQGEEIYFVREHAIRDLISNQYKGLDEAYTDYLLDLIYSEIYPED